MIFKIIKLFYQKKKIYINKQIKMNIKLIFLIINIVTLINLLNAASIFYESNNNIQLPNINDYEYSDDSKIQNSKCKCKNGGICVLDNDFCVCSIEYTGRFCEFELPTSNDDESVAENIEQFNQNKEEILNENNNELIDDINGCGSLMNGQTEYLNCAKCTCLNRILTCTALSKDRCDELRSNDDSDNNDYSHIKELLKENNYNIKNLIGSELHILIDLMNYVENNAYEIYIKEFESKYSKRDISNQFVDSEEYSFYYTNQNKLNSNQLIVLRSNSPTNHVTGLYFYNVNFQNTDFNQIQTQYLNSSSCSNFNLSFFNIFVFIIFIIIGKL
jgi:hypothetical protein